MLLKSDLQNHRKASIGSAYQTDRRGDGRDGSMHAT